MDKKLLIMILVMIFFAICTTLFFINLDKLIYGWSYVLGALNMGIILIASGIVNQQYTEDLKM